MPGRADGSGGASQCSHTRASTPRWSRRGTQGAGTSSCDTNAQFKSPQHPETHHWSFPHCPHRTGSMGTPRQAGHKASAIWPSCRVTNNVWWGRLGLTARLAGSSAMSASRGRYVIGPAGMLIALDPDDDEAAGELGSYSADPSSLLVEAVHATHGPAYRAMPTSERGAIAQGSRGAATYGTAVELTGASTPVREDVVDSAGKALSRSRRVLSPSRSGSEAAGDEKDDDVVSVRGSSQNLLGAPDGRVAKGGSSARPAEPAEERRGPQNLQKYPVFGWIMLAGCVAGLLYSFYLNNWQVQPLSQNAMLGPSVQALLEAGAKDTPLITVKGEWWRLFTPMFLHAGLIHLLTNMSVLLRFGWPMEQEAGVQRFAPVYLLGGLMGSVASAVFLPDLLSVGASGACFAIIGAVWGDMFQNWGGIVAAGQCCSCTVMFIVLSLTTAFNLMLGLMPFVDNFAHVFGFLGGVFVSSVLMIRPRRDREGASPWQLTCAWVGGCCYIWLLTALLLALYLGVKVRDWCPWCDYISCVEILDLWDCQYEVVRTNGTAVK
jgi:membrane associated rhomboid family serine protease